jgi:hypothetical protein
LDSLGAQVIVALALLAGFLLMPKARVDEPPPKSFRERVLRDLERDV